MISKYCAKIINVWNFSDPIVELNAFGIQWCVTKGCSTKNLPINVWKS